MRFYINCVGISDYTFSWFKCNLEENENRLFRFVFFLNEEGKSLYKQLKNIRAIYEDATIAGTTVRKCFHLFRSEPVELESMMTKLKVWLSIIQIMRHARLISCITYEHFRVCVNIWI